MISSSNQEVVIALRVAASRIVVPPEERWVRERRSAQRAWVIATLALALVALIAAVGALRGEPRTVPGSGSHTAPPAESPAGVSTAVYAVTDDAPWIRARARVAPGFVVLRPTWLPRASDSASPCELDLLRYAEEQSTDVYHLSYNGISYNGNRCILLLGGHRDPTLSGAPDLTAMSRHGFAADRTGAPLATFMTRGSVVYMWPYAGPGGVLAEWIEAGAYYEVIGTGFEVSELIRVVNSLEPVK